MEEQKGYVVNLKIGARNYTLTAESPEMEQYMRLAAKDINELLANLQQRFPSTSIEDVITFVAIQETVSKLSLRKELLDIRKAHESLAGEMDDYLKGINKK